jgi:hypothetical protein
MRTVIIALARKRTGKPRLSQRNGHVIADQKRLGVVRSRSSPPAR